MLGTRPNPVGLATLAIGALVGCQTARPELQATTSAAEVQELDPAEAQFAEGLAYYAQGLLHDYEGRFDAALTNYLRAVELDASNEELSIRIAMGLLQQKRGEEAIRIMETLVREGDGSEKALAFMALVYQAAGRAQEVRRTFQRWIETSPGSAAPYLQFGKFLRRSGDPVEVQEILLRGIRNAHEPGPLQVELAKHYLEQAAQAEDVSEAAAFRRRAMEQMEHAAEHAPQDVGLMRQIGQQAIRLGDAREALAWFIRIEEIRPQDLTIKNQLALDFIVDGNTDRAVELLQGVLTEQPDHRQAHYYLGELWLRKDDAESAYAAFRRAMDCAPQDPTAALRCALLQLEPMPEEAIRTLKSGLTHAPEDPRLLELLAHAYLAVEKPDQALEAFSLALVHADTENPPAQFFYHYARAAYLAGDVDQAVRLLWRTLDDNLAYLQLFMRESLAEAGQEKSEHVISFFEAFAEAYPDEPAAHLYLGMLKNYNEQYGEALNHFARAKSLAEEHHRDTQILNEDFYFAFGAAQERTGHIDEAARLFQTALVLDPNHDNAHNYLAYMWAERGIHLDQALDHIQKALAIDPDSGPFLDTLGWIYYMLEKYEDALRAIEKAAQLIPNDPTIADHLGDVLWKLDRESEALVQWKQAYRLDPENEKVARKLQERGVDLDALLADGESPISLPREPSPVIPVDPPQLPPTSSPAESGLPVPTPKDAILPEPASFPASAPPPPAETNAQPKL